LTDAITRITKSIEIYDTIDTTMEHPPPIQPGATIALEQTRGRGRTGPWISSRGGLWLTIHIPDTQPPPGLSVALGGCLAHTLNQGLPGHSLRVKWPNDIVAHGKKLAGILIEHRDDTLRIGIGINVYNKPPTGAVNLASLGYHGSLADALLATIHATLQALTVTETCIAQAASLDALRGCTVEAVTPHGALQGTGAGIAPDGALILDTGTTVERITCCHVRRYTCPHQEAAQGSRHGITKPPGPPHPTSAKQSPKRGPR